MLAMQLVILILVSILVVLQEDLDLVVHLRPNVVAETASYDSNNAKAERAEGRRAETNDVCFLERCSSSCDDLIRDTRDLSESRCTERQSRQERGNRTGGESSSGDGGRDELCGFRGLHVCENGLVDCDEDLSMTKGSCGAHDRAHTRNCHSSTRETRNTGQPP